MESLCLMQSQEYAAVVAVDEIVDDLVQQHLGMTLIVGYGSLERIDWSQRLFLIELIH